MSLRLLAVTLAAREPAALGSFWGSLLGRSPEAYDDLVLLPGTRAQVGLAFASGTGQPRFHLHVTSEGTTQSARVDQALDLGARHLDVGQLPEEEHVVLADPGGNAFCVINPDNRFLAGCGLLGEIACEGTREVGVFWAAALGWPLVWDADEETAVQSPAGGTKVAWGGPPIAPLAHPVGTWFDLVTDNTAAERSRLVALGATPIGGSSLADPDGQPFRLHQS